ncbi:FAD-binding protein [Mycobacterium sp. 155]|uniref:FAD-binding protein n=1 Tax=Mycobacterium sp. 155 TaxID=1157943 RepID=UPI00035DFC4E|nr:FAD-binding protein [Mycobacterium sp. 155]
MTIMSRRRKSAPPAPHEYQQAWVNWSRQSAAVPAVTVHPRSEHEVAECVRYAIANGLAVRPVGASHSWSPLCATSAMLIDMTGISGIEAVDTVRKRAVIHAGTRISAAGPALWDHGLSLINQGDIDAQTMVGAISTGTHGSGVTMGNLSSTVRRVRLVDGRGDIVEIAEDQPDLLRAAQLSLGLLGVITSIEIEVTDAYYLEEELTYPTWNELVSDMPADLAGNHHYSLWWLPADESAALYNLAVPDDLPLADRSVRRRINKCPGPARDTSASRVDRNYVIHPGPFEGNYFEAEIFVDAGHALTAMTRIRDICRHHRPEEVFPVQPRWVKGDDAYLSPAYRADSVGISIAGSPRTDFDGHLSEVTAALDDMNPRMHWGKLHHLDAQLIRDRYPELPAFNDARRRLDPLGLFLNDYTRELFT